MTRYRKQILRRFPPRTRQVAQLVNELGSTQTCLANRIEHDAANWQRALCGCQDHAGLQSRYDAVCDGIRSMAAMAEQGGYTALSELAEAVYDLDRSCNAGRIRENLLHRQLDHAEPLFGPPRPNAPSWIQHDLYDQCNIINGRTGCSCSRSGTIVGGRTEVPGASKSTATSNPTATRTSSSYAGSATSP